jgi:putative endonuclease
MGCNNYRAFGFLNRGKTGKGHAGMAAKSPGGWFVYMARCADGSLYTGITTDLARRSRQHNAGTASRYTRSRLPVTMVYTERVRDRSTALKREAHLKTLPRTRKEALIRTAA